LTEFGEEDGLDVVFECTGAEPCIQMAIHVRYISCILSVSLTGQLLGRYYWRKSYACRDGFA
jgi:threonine dehydrogenase-like Zn-dependent dehydrogenase